MLILDCSEAAELCANLKPFLNVVKIFLQVLRWTVPILLIALGSFDMFKAMANANDEKIVNEARTNLIKRIIYGVIVFLVPFLINVILELVGNAFSTEDSVNAITWIGCWNETIDMSSCTNIYEKAESGTSENNSNTTTNNNSSTTNNSTPSCTDYKCPSSAKIESMSISFSGPVYHGNSCQCKAVIPDPTVFDGNSSCTDISINDSTNYQYTTYENDNGGNIICYFKAVKKSSSSSNTNSDSNESTKCDSCARKNLISGNISNMTSKGGYCSYSAILDIDTNQTSCIDACKSAWGRSGFVSGNSNASGGCDCKYNTICQ